ncbi:hypothetical protein [Pseudomonas sp. FG-3G]|nr:hypothetical protein [Pseudomonas sp. FG-3G]
MLRDERRDFYLKRYSPVGASLLAIAVYQSTSMLTVRTLSRASSLPQV